MAFCRVVFCILVISVCSLAGQVPVFLWGDLKTSVPSNPLSQVNQDQFEGLLRKELKADPFTVIFIDETLSVEDFSRKTSDGETFPYLHANIGKAVYLPAVEDALPVLNNLADPEKVDHVKLTENGLSAEIVPDSVKILFITLKDAHEGESRSEMLRRHNDFMEEMFNKLQEKYGDVVAIYTAENPSWTIWESHSRVRRQAASNGDYTLDGLKLYVKDLYLTVGSQITTLNSLASFSSNINPSNMSTTLNFGEHTITLNFMQQAGYWFFNSVTVNQTESMELTSEPEVFAFSDFSYRCGQNVTFSRGSVSVRFVDLKVQPFFRETSNTTLEFGESINCVGFFSAPIWSGLFVVFILLAITFYGIMMMMDIRTMDRFDDPKGKTITINAAE